MTIHSPLCCLALSLSTAAFAAAPVAQIFGKPVSMDELVPETSLKEAKARVAPAELEKSIKDARCEAVRSRVWNAVFDDYMKKKKLEPSKAEIEACARSMHDSFVKEQPEYKDLPLDIEFATHALRTWKRDSALYREYGGRMIFQQFGAEPIDAWKKVLEKYEAQKAFTVTDPTLQECVYRYFNQKFLDVGEKGAKEFLAKPMLCQ